MVGSMSNNIFELVEERTQGAKIKVIGVGGGGGNAVEHMITSGLEGVDFICANTDSQALARCSSVTFQLGNETTNGLGAGADPDMGRQAAEEDSERIKEFLKGTDMLFVTSGMGGGTGTGAAPVVAKIAKELEILTVAVVTKPFPFEGRKRMDVADQGITQLEGYVDSLITIPNEKLLQVMGKQASLLDAFKKANDVLRDAVQGISELITNPGLINVDFADVRTVMRKRGIAKMGTGVASGEGRAAKATEMALNSPLLEDIDIFGARGVLVNITGGLDLSIGEFDDAGNMVKEVAHADATVVVGTVIDPTMQDEIRVTVVATGLGDKVDMEDEHPQLNMLDSAEDAVAAAGGGVVSVVPAPVSVGSSGNSGRTQEKAASYAGVDTQDKESMDYLDIPAFLRKQAD